MSEIRDMPEEIWVDEYNGKLNATRPDMKWWHEQERVKYLRADLAHPRPVDGEIEKYKPGTWFCCGSLDQMQAFYQSRLPAIREVAREHGYAIAVHGSMRRDFDLIAVPWREGYSSKDVLAKAVQVAACGLFAKSYQWEQKPVRRVAVSIPICWVEHDLVGDKKSMGHIDLSVMEAPPALDVDEERVTLGDLDFHKRLHTALAFLDTCPDAGADRAKALETVIEGARRYAANGLLRGGAQPDKKAAWIGQHVQNGWIAYDWQLFDPEFYVVQEKGQQPAVDTDGDIRGEICKIISRMLDNPDEIGIYPTTECFDELERLYRTRLSPSVEGKFKLGDRVEKIKGSSWRGKVVGFYSTTLTPTGYAVESENEPGSVQIYPESALQRVLSGKGDADG